MQLYLLIDFVTTAVFFLGKPAMKRDPPPLFTGLTKKAGS
jgi:hypothetical protein